MLEHAKKIQGWMTEAELAFLYAIAESMNSHGKVVEVGSWKGRSTVAICSALKQKNQIEFYAIDTFRGDPEINSNEIFKLDIVEDLIYKEFQENTAEFTFLKTIRANSEQAVNNFADESLDWIFIDADHSYNSVYNDVRLWFPKLKYGGLISGHDYGRIGVTRAINILFKDVNVWDTIWYVRRSQKAPNNRLIPRIEVALRRWLLRQHF